MTSKRSSSSILFTNARNKVLFFLRDDKKTIPYPNMWDFLGGSVDPGETPERCIIREMYEELGLSITNPQLYKVVEFPNRFDNIYWEKLDVSAEVLNQSLTEGQYVRWFTQEEALKLELAFDFDSVLPDFFQWLNSRSSVSAT